jgi:hypothetical protein
MNNSALIASVQKALHLSLIDGKAGHDTWAAICNALHVAPGEDIDLTIRVVQRRLNLDDDGIDGPDTWASINRSINTGNASDLETADQHIKINQDASYWQQLFKGKRGENDFVKLVAVRGWLAGSSKDNRTDIYDDVIVRIMGSRVDLFKAAVDPTTYLIQHPINADGAAQLTKGVWLMRRGIHKGVAEHKCLIQAEDFVVNRLTKDGQFSHRDTGDFGIHNHPGGASDTTDRFSAGCQIIHMPDFYWGPYWFTSYYYPLSDAMDAHKQHTIAYNLVNAEDLP